MIDETYFQEPTVTELETMRDKARTKRRITFDCFNAVVFSDDRVECTQKYFSQPISLLAVLRGRSTAVCVKCADYDDGGESERRQSNGG